jgi:hypothetical protein
MNKTFLAFTILCVLCAAVQAAEIKVSSPDGKAVVTVTDAGGLSYAVAFDGREVLVPQCGITLWSRTAGSRTALISARM